MKKHILAMLALCFSYTIGIAQQTEEIYLSGHDATDARQWDFYCSKGMNSGKWRKIAVPSCWEQQGYGEYTYGRYYKTKGLKASDERGTYRTKFSIPKSWADKKVEIVFEGAMTDALVSVNGKQVGEKHQGGFTAFSYDITNNILVGKKNTLEVVVDKQSANKSVNTAERMADWWLFGGIYRPVYLRALPKVSIENVLIDARADGSTTLRLYTNGNVDGLKLKAKIDGLAEQTATLADSTVQSVAMRFNNVVAWNPEHPKLYTLKLYLTDKKGNTIHTTNSKIGFRTIEFRERDGFYLNGTKLIVKGVNRHCCYPEIGRTPSKLRDIADVKLIKGMNANAIRSHYPPGKEFLDICDSLGILYLNELPGWQHSYATNIGTKILTEMITHDASHPCIFVWSNGNEGGNNFALDKLFAQLDPQKRHVVHPWALWNHVDTHHYPAYQTGIGRLANGYEVFMPTEFLHSLYDKGGGASLDDYWRNYKRNPLFAGGFIWAFADEGIARTDKAGYIDTYTYMAPDGIVGPHREKEASWYTIRDVWCPIQFAPMALQHGWNGKLLITNDYLFSSLSQCNLAYQAISIKDNGETSIKSEGVINMPDIAPGESRWISVADPTNIKGADVLQLTATTITGDTINTWSWPLVYANEYHKRYAGPEAKENNGKAMVEGTSLKAANGVVVTFDKTTGMIASIKKEDCEIPFGNGPIPVGFKMKLDTIKAHTDGNDAVLAMYYKGGADSIVWRMTPDGKLGMDALLLNRRDGGKFDGKFFDDSPNALGLTFSYPETDVEGMTWLGKGPYRVWRNRQRGMTFNKWHKAYNNTITGEGNGERLVYPEFKGFHGNVYWAKIESNKYPLSIQTETDGLYLRVFTPEEPKGATEHTMQTFPKGDISLLLDIPGIKSYKPIEQLGPQAQPANIRINKGDEGLHIKTWFEF